MEHAKSSYVPSEKRLNVHPYSVTAIRTRLQRSMPPADTPDGPSLALGKGAVEALEHALEPFEGTVEELLESLPGAAIR
jgi:hypothetical protein